MFKRLIIAAALLASPPALAVDFTSVLVDDDGCPFRDEITMATGTSTVAGPTCPVASTYKPDLTLGAALYYALRSTYSDEPTPKLEEKLRRGDLARRIRSAKNYVPNAEEATLMKTLIAKLYSVPIVMAVVGQIDPGAIKK